VSGKEVEMDLFEVSEGVRTQQMGKLAKVKSERDNALVTASLKKLRETAADSHRNLMPPILDAVRAYASIGEICGVLREVFGEYRESYNM
jgi:methylmalonyl-CoA mutase N-terminal domain/subunit